MIRNNHIHFIDPASPARFWLNHLFDEVCVFILVILVLVSTMFAFTITGNSYSSYITESDTLERAWTLIPLICLGVIAVPSLALLYRTSEVKNPMFTIKIAGNQWYWDYEYTANKKTFQFPSYIKQINRLQPGELRLLEVDNRPLLPSKTEVRLNLTSNDVLHSWALPSIAVKVDCSPGRLNQISFQSLTHGIFYGQCSEICGAGHSFMPIAVEVSGWENFVNWVGANLTESTQMSVTNKTT